MVVNFYNDDSVVDDSVGIIWYENNPRQSSPKIPASLDQSKIQP
jgi:hypothetical protein